MSKLDKLDRETNELAIDYKEEVAEEEELEEAEVTKKNLDDKLSASIKKSGR